MTKNVLVTGGAGYIGSRLVETLLFHGYGVSVVLRASTDPALLAPFMDRVSVLYDEGSIGRMSEFMQNQQIGCVVHLATLYITHHKTEDIDHLIQSNITFGVHVLEAMKQAGVRRIVYARTGWQHYHDEAYNPVDLYAATKQAFEDIMKYYTQAEGFRSIAMELYDTYGEFDPRGKLINRFKRCLQTGEETALSPGEQKLDLVYIKDVAKAFLQAVKRSLLAGEEEIEGEETETGKVKDVEEAYAVTSGCLYTLREIVDLWESVYGQGLKIDWGAKSYRPREVFVPYRGLGTIPGWKAEYGLREGFEQMRQIENQRDKK